MFTLAKTIFLTTFSTNAPILRDIEKENPKEIGRTQHMQIILILLHILKRAQNSNNDFPFFGLEKNSKNEKPFIPVLCVTVCRASSSSFFEFKLPAKTYI